MHATRTVHAARTNAQPVQVLQQQRLRTPLLQRLESEERPPSNMHDALPNGMADHLQRPDARHWKALVVRNLRMAEIESAAFLAPSGPSRVRFLRKSAAASTPSAGHRVSSFLALSQTREGSRRRIASENGSQRREQGNTRINALIRFDSIRLILLSNFSDSFDSKQTNQHIFAD